MTVARVDDGSLLKWLDEQATALEQKAAEFRTCWKVLVSLEIRQAVAAPPPKKHSTKKKAKATTKPSGKKPTAPTSDTEPRKLRGRLPSTNVETHVCMSDNDRAKFIAGLKERGLRRCAPLERLAPGLFDVIERDGDATVIWREPANEEPGQ